LIGFGNKENLRIEAAMKMVLIKIENSSERNGRIGEYATAN
jgi:hypothetical protein